MNKIKFSIRLFAVVIGLLIVMQMPSLAATGKSTATNVRVRASASTDAEVIELLAVNDNVEILSKEGDWYKVSFKGKTGYVSQSFISTNENVEEANSDANTTQNIEGSENNSASKEQSNENTNNVSEQNTNNTENVNVQANEVAVNTEANTSDNQAVSVTTKVYKMAEASGLNILPVVNSESIGDAKQDEKVTLISSAGLWAYIKTDKITGWVRIDKLSVEEVMIENNDSNETTVESTTIEENSKNEQETPVEQPQENTEVAQESNYTPKTMYTNVAAVNVRGQANTSSDVVGAVGINTQVRVVGEQDGWYKVEVNGKTGFIRKDLLSNEKTEISSRSNEIDRATAAAKAEEVAKVAEPAVTVTTTAEPVATPAQTTVVEETNTNQTANAQETATQTPAPVAQEPAVSEADSSNGVTGNDIVAYAKQFLGCRYVYGASGPSSFDCSGLTMYVYAHFGYSLSHSSRVQATQGRAVTGNLQPGDILVFSNDGKTVGHVGIYIGNDQFIHAADSSTGVVIGRLSDKWNKSKYWGARRIL